MRAPARLPEIRRTAIDQWHCCCSCSTTTANPAVLTTGAEAMATVMNSTGSSGLAEVVDRILDKGIVIDAWAKLSLVGIELVSIEARVVVASVETYLKYAEAIGLTASAAAPLA